MENWKTTLFEWARAQGWSRTELARRLGYSRRHLLRIEEGEQEITDQFIGRVVLRLGEEARSLFFRSVSQNSDEVAEHQAA